MSRRRQARELAFRAAYQADVTGDPVEHCYREILEDLEEAADPVTRDFAGALVSTLALHLLHFADVPPCMHSERSSALPFITPGPLAQAFQLDECEVLNAPASFPTDLR